MGIGFILCMLASLIVRMKRSSITPEIVQDAIPGLRERQQRYNISILGVDEAGIYAVIGWTSSMAVIFAHTQGQRK